MQITKFIFRIIVFTIPLTLLFSFELFLPLTFFTYRPFEALLFQKDGMRFIPNQKVQMISEGDLCAHTSYAIPKNECWITDSLGFRNDCFLCDPDVCIIGDSFMAGLSLHQDSTLTNTLNRKANGLMCFYCMAPVTLSDFKHLLDLQVIHKPKVVIFSIVERYNPPALCDLLCRYESNRYSILKQKLTRRYCPKYLFSTLSKKFFQSCPQSPVNEKMFFYDTTNIQETYMAVENARIIQTYKNFCDSLSIDFIFLPMPNKETVYFDEVPFAEQPHYLFELAKELDNAGIENINTLEIYNNFRANSDKRIYHFDDTHWNWNAVDIISDTIMARLSERFVLLE